MSRIVHTPEPTVAGTDVTVREVIYAYDFLKYGPEDIAHKHDVSVADVEAALAYYYEHRGEFVPTPAEAVG
ncbi:DUF433 domain-containing protein [Halobium palmae]|uniref:DUF433 domain-containing protein n=1 Tax=Halobium palmae TaxID=1776492 RepID=A0ABD5RXA0_9EURY